MAITGPMFAGKTTRLIEYAEQAFAAGLRTVIVRSSYDQRGDKEG